MRSVKIAALAALATSLVAGQALAGPSNACERAKHDRKVTGTVLGAVGGAVAGNLIAGHGNKTLGTVVGAGGGAVVGNQLARDNHPCPPDHRPRRHPR
jgi:uncharacterized membrane protein